VKCGKTQKIMPAAPDISDSEWAIMEALWESSPQTASEVTKTLRPTTNWAENTVRTLLTRLVEKGALKTGENASGTRTFLPAVKREACVRAESESFMQRIFGGAAKPLLVHFAQNSKLTAEEIKELKKLLDQQLNS
jgi:BlaI family transcriptional regulator, penicillinase repressor